MNALLVGRFHAVTAAQEHWLQSLKGRGLEQVICVLTSANHQGTRRNPLPVEARKKLVAAALEGLPYRLVSIDDIASTEAWVSHVLAEVERAGHRRPTPTDTQVYTANRDVAQLFSSAGFQVVSDEVTGLTPHELVQRIAEGQPWVAEASKATQDAYRDAAFLKALFGHHLLNDDGELGHARDFHSYGAQMDAALQQKLADLLPWVKPGCVVDKGCGTGKLMVELSRVYPASSFVGVELSREFLRRCDENTYFSEDVELLHGNIAEQNVPEASATTVIFSSVTHEIYSYNGYSLPVLERAMAHAVKELQPGGRLLMRDGVSPDPARWRLRFLNTATREVFERFSREFKQGAGVVHHRLSGGEVELSAHDANEFLCKKDYLKNWHIEVNEEFGPLTLEGWRELLLEVGLRPVHLQAYVNPWIAANRYAGSVELTDDAGRSLPWPATNCVVVGEKP